jgi:hypothetical protein
VRIGAGAGNTVIVPPHTVQLLLIAAGMVPVFAQFPVCPLVNVALGADVNDLACSQVMEAGNAGIVSTATGEGLTVIVTTRFSILPQISGPE